jgi:hypothetical protein
MLYSKKNNLDANNYKLINKQILEKKFKCKLTTTKGKLPENFIVDNKY